ncbi:39S ribosomal protein L42 [Prionailurus iriomotensis]
MDENRYAWKQILKAVSPGHLSHHRISILSHHGISSSKTGDIKQNYLETFISDSKTELYIVFVINLRIRLFQMTIIDKVELALTSDGRTIVCYHPSVDIPYEHTKPIPRPDPVCNNEETHDQVLKTRLEEKNEPLEQGPMIEQLSKMFFTTKHRWYPRGQYHRRRRKLDPPKDR